MRSALPLSSARRLPASALCAPGLVGLALVGLALAARPAPAQDGGPDAADARGRGYVALRAGTIHVVADGRVIEGGGTLLVRDGRVQAVGEDVDVPLDARVVDYGDEAVLVPGFVAGESGLASGTPAERTAAPGVRAIDAFDFWSEHATQLAGGVVTAHVSPTDRRLIGGEGAVVKLAGRSPATRTLRAPADLVVALHEPARNAPAYWEPPVPATADVGLGYARQQLPRTVMGALVALDELLSAARGEGDREAVAEEFGEEAIDELAADLEAGLRWLVHAHTEDEIRAALDLARRHDLDVVVVGATYAGELADELAEAGVPVVYEVPFTPNRGGVDRGKDRDTRWPDLTVAAKLAAAGVPVAVSGAGPTSDLLFYANLATTGGLDPAAALRAITLTPAEIHGVADRVGSLRPGADADVVVLNGPPISGTASVVATWVAGELAWSIDRSGSAADDAEERSRPVVVQVDELHTGDGQVLSPGQVVIRDGRIVSVEERHSQPLGARVVRGRAAMPGIVDAHGHLGLEGSQKVPSLDFRLASLVGPGDRVDRHVARAGVTTVGMAPRGASDSGTPVLVYKPAASDEDRQVVADPAAIVVQWEQEDRLKSGDGVRDLLGKARDYRQRWIDYERELAEWTPPPPEPPEDEDEKDEEEEEDEDADDEEEDDDEEEETTPDPVTGVWEATVERPPLAEASPLRMQLRLESEAGASGDVVGNLRSAALTEGLVDVEGWWDADARTLRLRALGSRGWITIEGEVPEPEKKKKKKKKKDDDEDGEEAPPGPKLVGTIDVGGAELDLEAVRTSTEYRVVARTRRAPEEEPAPEEPKGKPKPPREDQKLEPLRRAMDGEGSVLVFVNREDEILAAVATFEEFGIEPVLLGARDAHLVADRLAGRVRGVVPSHRVRVTDPRRGTEVTNPFAELQAAGVPVAFHSGAEEGAVDLPQIAMYAVSQGMSPVGALRALTADAARVLDVDERVGVLAPGRDGDVVVLDGPPLAPGTRVVRVLVNGEEVAE